MTRGEIKSALGLECLPEDVFDGFETSEENYSSDMFFISDLYARYVSELISLPGEVNKAYTDFLERVRENGALSRYLYHLYRVYTLGGGWPSDEIPVPCESAAGENPRMLNFALLTSMIPSLSAWFSERGIPYKYFKSTMESVNFQLEICKRNTGAWGIHHVNWCTTYFRGGIFAVGRFAVRLKKYGGIIGAALKSRKSRDTVVLYSAGYDVRRDGHINGTNGVFEDGTVRTVLEESAEGISGHPTGGGKVGREKQFFPFNEYEKIFSPGDEYIEVHIPSGPSLTHDLVVSSLKEAYAFFAEYFAARPKAYVCTSWLLDELLEKNLPDTSNILAFQRLFRLIPYETAGGGVYYFLFGGDRERPETWEVRTSFQKRMKEYLQSGGIAHENCGILFPHQL